MHNSTGCYTEYHTNEELNKYIIVLTIGDLLVDFVMLFAVRLNYQVFQLMFL